MARLNLNIYIMPGEVEVFLNILLKNGSRQNVAATIDTGAAVSLLPLELLAEVEHDTESRRKLSIQQAGMANQTFEAVEAIITLFLEDQSGNQTPEIKTKFWFADTEVRLVGFADILENCVLHLDMPKRSGWLEYNVLDTAQADTQTQTDS